MKKLIVAVLTILFVTTCIIREGYAQTQSMHIVFQKQEKPQYSSTYFLEEKDVSKFKVPEGIKDFAIGYQNISYYHHLYNNRHLSEANLLKYQSIVEEYNIDTLQFIHNSLKNTILHVLFYMQNGVKHCILDTDFDNSFVNEQLFKFEKNEITDNYPHFFTNLKIPIDSLSHSTTKLIPVGIKSSTSSVTGDNVIADSLQVDIFPNFSYQGHLIDDSDTILMDFPILNFDQFYLKQKIDIFCRDKSFDYFDYFKLGETIHFKNRKYLFEDLDIYTKTLIVKRLEDDSIGINRGNYFATMPELDSFHSYTLVFFTGSWCKPCKFVLDSLLVFHQQYPEITIISVNQEPDTLAFIKHVETYKIPWKVIYDKTYTSQYGVGNSLYHATYRLVGVPYLFLINPERRVLRMGHNTVSCIKILEDIQEKGIKAFEIED